MSYCSFVGVVNVIYSSNLAVLPYEKSHMLYLVRVVVPCKAFLYVCCLKFFYFPLGF